jgi:hypothetical protein
MKGKVLRITRTRPKRDGTTEREVEIVEDEDVFRDYKVKSDQQEMEALVGNIANFKPSGDAARDAQMITVLNQELSRLQKNKERRHVREQQKGRGVSSNLAAGGAGAATPGGAAGGEDGEGKGRAAGTQRRCANCGQIGHIKTNKKLCPLLNGTMQPPTGFDTGAFGGSNSVAATPATERTFSL